MNEVEVLDTLTGIFRQVFEDASLVARPELTAQDVKKWDSLSHVDMIVMVEEAFGIRISTREVASLKNVGDLVRVVLSKRK
jgi:acyl carrier protein